jgi:ATP-dependent Lhr-like helicase
VVTRETVAAEAVAGGFTAIYQVLKTMEEAGRIRRGYFVAGLGGAQFATPAAVEMLREMRNPSDTPNTRVLAATDPANPYGAIVRWPPAAIIAGIPDPGSGVGEPSASRVPHPGSRSGPTRSAGARVVLVDGALTGYLRRGERELLLLAPTDEPRRSQVLREVARALRDLARRRGMLLAEIDGGDATAHPAAAIFVEQGFVRSAMGLQLRPEAQGLAPTGGTVIAAALGGDDTMAEQTRTNDNLVGTPAPDETETRETEQERVRFSNDRDQVREREGQTPPHARGYDEAVRGQQDEDMDPDSAEADVDRDDESGR